MYQAMFFFVSVMIGIMGQEALLHRCIGKIKGSLAISASNTVLIIAVAANALAAAGIYSLKNITLLLFVLGLLFCFFFKISIDKMETGKGVELMPVFVFLVCLVMMFLAYSLFTIVPFGIGRDPSAYFYEGVHIAESGSIRFAGDAFIEQNYLKLKDILDINGAGLYSSYEYGISDTPGDVVIQFLHMFPSMLAIGYDLAGVRGMQLVNPIIAVLCACMIFLYMRDVIEDKKAAWIAFFLCALNPAQIYSARISQTELLCQLIFILSIYYFAIAWRKRTLWMLSLSGMLVGLMTFNRIDMYILGAGVFVLALYHIWIKPENIKAILVYSFSYVVVGGLALWYGCAFSYPYYKDHWDMGVLSAVLIGNILLLALVLISLAVRKYLLKDLKVFDPIEFFSENKKAILILMAVLVCAFLFAYFLRPFIGGRGRDPKDPIRFQNNAMVEFCFYTSFIAVFFAIYGIYKLIRNISGEVIGSYLPWAFMGMSNLLVYIYNPSIASDQIWASRRWVTICIPFVLMLTAVGISRIRLKKATAFAQTALCAGIVAFLLYQGRGFLFKDIGGQIWEEYGQFAKTIDEDGLYFCSNKFTVTILREIWGKRNVYRTDADFGNNIEEYLKDNDAVYYVGDIPSGIKNNMNLTVRKVADYTLYSNELERAYGVMPTQIVPSILCTDIYRVEYTGSRSVEESIYRLDQSVPERFNLEHFGGENREAAKNAVKSNGTAGYLLFGPYDKLENGTYEICVDFTVYESGDAGQEEIAFFEVVGRDQKLMNRQPIYDAGEGQIKLPFSVNGGMDNIEYRFYTYEGTVAEINKVELLQLSDCFAPGLDDWNSIHGIKQLFPQEKVAYCYGASAAGVLLEGLGDRLPDELVFENFCSVEGAGGYDVIAAKIENMDWFSLLEKYDLIFRKGSYLVFGKRNTDYGAGTDIILSKDGYINLEALYAERNGRYIAGVHETIPAAGYEFKIELEEGLAADFAEVSLYQNGNMLAQTELKQGENAVTVSVDSESRLSDLSVEIVDSENTMLEGASIWLKQNMTAEEIFWANYLEPAVEDAKAAAGRKELVFLESDRRRIVMAEEGFRRNGISAEIPDSARLTISELDGKDLIISEKDAYRESELLGAGYTVVCSTPLYALYVSENMRGSFAEDQFLSDGKYLLAEFYENTQENKEKTLSLDKGSYDLSIRIELPEGKNAEVLQGSNVWIESKGEMVSDIFAVRTEEGNSDSHVLNMCIPMYFRERMEKLDVKLEMAAEIAGVTCRIEKIKPVSEKWQIRLDRFAFLGGELNEEGIVAEAEADNIIYGPYYDLDPGAYSVQMVFEAEDIADIKFDVAINGGMDILAEAAAEESINVEEKYTIELPFEIPEGGGQAEFRTWIPSGKRLVLKEVNILQE